MFRAFWPKRRALPRIPAGQRVYAIGDIHGRADLLRLLLTDIAEDIARDGAEQCLLVFLGDYLDRGPDSRGVVDILIRLPGDGRLGYRFLRGNHDQVALDFLADANVGPGWSDYGGRECLTSYGVAVPRLRGDLDAWVETSRAFAAALPTAHRRFLETLEDSLTIGDYFFAHAGARPGVPLADQSREDLLWIRQPFLESATPFDKVVVHGHTPTESPHSDARRVGVDTGAYATNVLTAVRLQSTGRSFIQVSATASRQPVAH